MPISKPFFGIAVALLFVVGAAIAHAGVPFRLALVPILCAPLLVFRGPALGWPLLWLLVLGAVACASSLRNSSSLLDTALFLRLIVTPYVMYVVARSYLRPDRVDGALRFAIWLGILQLPVVLVQRLGYRVLAPLSRHGEIPEMDFVSGTFFISNDPAMSFFLLGLVALLLLCPTPPIGVRLRTTALAACSLAVLVGNSMLSHLLLLALWAYAIGRRINPSRLVGAGILTLLAAGTFVGMGWAADWLAEMELVLRQLTLLEPAHMDRFLAGEYNRVAAVYYYATSPLSLLGAGPSSSYDPLTQARFLGNTGHHFLLYGEVGLLGWLSSVLFFIAVARQYCTRTSRHFVRTLVLLLMALGVTTNVMSDASIMLAYVMLLALSLGMSVRTAS